MRRNYSFTKWLKTKETFNSYGHYKWWLSIKTNEEANIIDQYYHEKFEHWKKYLQTDFD